MKKLSAVQTKILRRLAVYGPQYIDGNQSSTARALKRLGLIESAEPDRILSSLYKITEAGLEAYREHA